MSLRCVIIDDEPLAISILERYVQQTSFLELAEKFTSPVKAINYLSENVVDLIFLDIQMPDITGLELAANLVNKPAIIFTTAYSEYALAGFKADAIDYLLKPIDYPDFLRAVNKANDWVATRKEVKTAIGTTKDYLFIKSEYKIIRINFSNIRYIQGMSEYVRIFLNNGKPIMSLMSMKSLEENLPEHQFMRVHKSYIVNLESITMIERQEIVYDNGTIIPVSNQYKEKFQKYIESNFIS